MTPSKFQVPNSKFQIPSPKSSAFTLLELVIALTIIAVIVAAAVPSYQGMADAQKARAPVRELMQMAKEARRRAIAERRPYQITFTEDGFIATRFFSPYAEQSDLDTFIQEINLANEAFVANRTDLVEEDPDSLETILGIPDLFEDQQLALSYKLPKGFTTLLYLWGEEEPVPISGALTKTWVFQATGISRPIRARFEKEGAYFEVTFNALTADIEKERSRVE